MGVFDVHCSYSGIALIGDAVLVLLVKRDGRWKIISAPFRGFYDRYGRIEMYFDGPSHDRRRFETFVAWATEQFSLNDFERVQDSMLDGDFVWKEDRISYALVDADVYDALPSALSTADPNLPECLQCPWKSALDGIPPIDVENSDQYCGFEGEYGCRKRVELALARFANSPNIVAAIKRNARAWQELDESD